MSEERTHHRLNNLESSLAYLQKDYDSLNEAVLENTKRLEQIKQAVTHLTRQLEGLIDASNEPRRVEDEKPPHY